MIDALTDQNNALNMEVASLKDALEVRFSDFGYTRMPREGLACPESTRRPSHHMRPSPLSPDEFGIPFYLQLFTQNLSK